MAEVLIVLGIIGLVADMTIPTLITDIRLKTNVVKLKKLYSNFENAFRMAVAENGTIETWIVSGDITASCNNFQKYLSPYFRTVKVCPVNDANCNIFGGKMMKSLTNVDYGVFDDFRTNHVKFQLADGSAFMVGPYDDCSSGYCGDIHVDLNGEQPPNKLGIDAFYFYMKKDGVIPIGLDADPSVMCNAFDVRGDNSLGCAAWVIYNENMDYLKCKDLSWNSKRRCD